ncbi:MAG: peroxidase-related enzyme, partial [Pseudomonadota bacterium]
EVIAVAVSAVNHCHYCLTAHGAAVRQRAGDANYGDTIVHNYRAASLDARQTAMLDFAIKLTEQPAKIVEADRQTLRDVGFSDRDIWDIAAVAAFYNMSNRLAVATEMKPNAEYFSMARD